MVTLKTRVRSSSTVGHRVRGVQITEQHPEQIVGIKTSRVYSQIARMSRASNKQAEKAILIAALESARVNVNMGGQTVKLDPQYVPMRVDQVKACFGLRAQKLPYNSFVHIDDYEKK